MRTQIKNYTFDKTTKTITFSDFEAIRLDSVLMVTNATDGLILYNFADPSKGGTVLTNKLTLAYDTAAMNNNDKLKIIYEDENYPSSDETITLLTEQLDNNDRILRQLLELLKPLGITVSGSGRVSIDVNTLPAITIAGSQTLATVTTVGTVTNQTNMGGLNALDLQYNIARVAFAQGISSNITF